MKPAPLITALFVVCTSAVSSSAQQHWTVPCNVVWNSPSHDAAGSMPMGDGQVGIDLWVEEDGDLRFYISRTDSLSEVSRLLKVGGVRISLDPNPFKKGLPFRQEFKLADGVCEITAGEGGGKVTLTVFVDSDAPVIHVLGNSASPLKVKAAADVWRTGPHTLAGGEVNSAWTMQGSPTPLVESADVFPANVDNANAVAWYHRNETSPAFTATLKVQSLESAADKVHDPLLHRTFGGWMTISPRPLAGEGPGVRIFKSADGHAIESDDAINSFALRIAAPCSQTPTAQAWLDEAQRLASATADTAAPARPPGGMPFGTARGSSSMAMRRPTTSPAANIPCGSATIPTAATASQDRLRASRSMARPFLRARSPNMRRPLPAVLLCPKPDCFSPATAGRATSAGTLLNSSSRRHLRLRPGSRPRPYRPAASSIASRPATTTDSFSTRTPATHCG